ncbi:MAG: rhomboid family intramembrane serine protease [Methylacidiphilales bacterium]|nr:rhomboid family intramembrane serine protease [Candidatus Methylacidiphilales bacterium]
MLYHEQSEDYRPLFWMNGQPIYVNTLLIILHVLAFIGVAIAMSFLGPGVLEFIDLSSTDVLYYGQVWRLFSYVVFPPSIWFIFAMGFLFFVGREVEQYIGRRTYLKLYLALIFIPSILLSLAGLISPQEHLGGTESVFGVFIAFATLYPGMTLNIWFTNLTAKGWAWGLLGIYSLIDVAYHQWSSLLVLWICAAVGYLGMRVIGAGRGATWFTDWLEERRAQKLIRQRNLRVLEDRKVEESVDAVLEKISKHGVGSLNASERAVLERTRADLIKRDKH